MLHLHSRNDFAASPEAAEAAFDLMASKDKRLVWYEKSDHHLFHDYDREAVIDEVLAFIGDLEERAIKPPPSPGP